MRGQDLERKRAPLANVRSGLGQRIMWGNTQQVHVVFNYEINVQDFSAIRLLEGELHYLLPFPLQFGPRFSFCLRNLGFGVTTSRLRGLERLSQFRYANALWSRQENMISCSRRKGAQSRFAASSFGQQISRIRAADVTQKGVGPFTRAKSRIALSMLCIFTTTIFIKHISRLSKRIKHCRTSTCNRKRADTALDTFAP
jgi:hypothetical protein